MRSDGVPSQGIVVERDKIINASETAPRAFEIVRNLWAFVFVMLFAR